MNANGEMLNTPAGALNTAGSLNRTLLGVASALHWARDALFNAATAIGVSRAAHEFQMLSDEQLAQIGMTRDEIPARLRAMLDEVRNG